VWPNSARLMAHRLGCLCGAVCAARAVAPARCSWMYPKLSCGGSSVSTGPSRSPGVVGRHVVSLRCARARMGLEGRSHRRTSPRQSTQHLGCHALLAPLCVGDRSSCSRDERRRVWTFEQRSQAVQQRPRPQTPVAVTPAIAAALLEHFWACGGRSDSSVRGWPPSASTSLCSTASRGIATSASAALTRSTRCELALRRTGSRSQGGPGPADDAP
jgi:hypothetical protein